MGFAPRGVVATDESDFLASHKRQFFYDRIPEFSQQVISYINATHIGISLASQWEVDMDSVNVALMHGSTAEESIFATVVAAYKEKFTCEQRIHPYSGGDGYTTWLYQFFVEITGISLDMETDKTKFSLGSEYYLVVKVTALPLSHVSYNPSSPLQQPFAPLNFTLPTTFSDETYTILSYGDMNVNSASRSTLLNLLTQYNNRNPLKMIIHQGDLPYAWDGQQQKWDDWAQQVLPLTQNLFYQVGPGNHEKSSFCKFETFEKRFTPWWGHTSGSNTNLWYSFDYLGIHWISVSSEHPYHEGTPQYEWLTHDLASVDRKRTPFVVFYAHRPMFSSNDNHGSDEVLRKWIQPVLEANQVDLALFGHVHAYERARPFSNGTIYVESGTAGYDLNPKWDEPAPAWSQYRETSHGFLRLTVKPFQSIQVEYLRNNFGSYPNLDAQSIVADSFVIESRFADKEQQSEDKPVVEKEEQKEENADKNIKEDTKVNDSPSDTITLLNGYIVLGLLSMIISCCLFGYLIVKIYSRRQRTPQEFQMLHQEFDFSSGEDTSVGDADTDAADPRFTLDDSSEEAV